MPPENTDIQIPELVQPYSLLYTYSDNIHTYALYP